MKVMRVKEGNKELDIKEAAIRVFAESGFHKAKIAKIAELANVAAGSVYLYYKNKEDILARIFLDLWKELYENTKAIAERSDINPVEKIEYFVDSFFNVFNQKPEMALVFVHEQNQFVKKPSEGLIYYDKFLAQGEFIISQGIETEDFSKNISVKVLRYFILGGVRFVLEHWAKAPDDYTLVAIRENLKAFLTKGLSS